MLKERIELAKRYVRSRNRTQLLELAASELGGDVNEYRFVKSHVLQQKIIEMVVFRASDGKSVPAWVPEVPFESDDDDEYRASFEREPEPEPVARFSPYVPAPAPDDTLAQLGALITKIAGTAINEDRVIEIVDERVANIPIPSRVIEIVNPGGGRVEIDGLQHPMFEKVLRLASAGLNVLLVGPAGCGKTHLAAEVAKALGHTFSTISGAAGVSEAQIVGRLLPTGDGGKFEYIPSPFVTQYTKEKGAFLFDELDGFDPNTLLVINQATANGGFEIEARAASKLDTYVARSETFILMASANTFGYGAGAMYVGRNQLDAASVDRWYTVEMGYDPVLEARLAGMPVVPGKAWEPAPAPSQSEIESLARWVLGIRDKAMANKLRRIVSTRALQKAIAARRAGIPSAEIKRDLLAGWTPDELAKVGEK